MKFLLRLIRRDPATFLLNIIGLAIGIGAFASLQVYVTHERSFDRFHDNADQLYRLSIYRGGGSNEYKSAIVHGIWAEFLENDVAGVKKATKAVSVQADVTLRAGEKLITAKQGTGFYADPDFLDVLRFKLKYGNRADLLAAPNSVVLTRSLARRLFDKEDVVGEQIVYQYGDDTPFRVTGVLEDVPANSHMQFEYVVSGSSFPEYWERQNQVKIGSFTTFVYAELERDAHLPSIEASIQALSEEHFQGFWQYPIQPVTDIHFNVDGLFDHAKAGNETFVDILWMLSFLVLFVAIINYILLTASQLYFRAQEVSIRKTLGASRWRIFATLIKEAVLLSIVAGVLCVIIVQFAAQDAFPRWFGVQLDLLTEPGAIAFILLVCISAGAISGLLPALNVSRQPLAPALKGRMDHSGKSLAGSRLVIFQFAFTFLMLLGAVMVMKQLQFLKGKDLGYERDAVINISRATGIDLGDWRYFREQVTSLNSVEAAGSTQYEFIGDYNGHGLSVINGQDTSFVGVQWNGLDEGAVEALGLRFVEGRNFDPSFSTDSNAVILNQAAAAKLNVEGLLGKKAMNGIARSGESQIIGIVDDFHFQSFDQEIRPTAFFYPKTEGWKRNLLVKFNTSNYQQVLRDLEETWVAAGIQAPFGYQFLDDWFERMIAQEQRMANLIMAFGLATLVITCLGLVGTVRFQMLRQRKPIGIRKVFGASILSVLLGINGKFLIRIAVSMVVALPLGILGVNRWLDNFVYRAEHTVVDYLVALGIMLVFTFFVITLQSWRTVNMNPAEVLKNE